MRRAALFAILSLAALFFGGCTMAPPPKDVAAMNWNQILADAKCTNLTLMMWGGDPYINAYMNNFVKPQLKKAFDVTLNISEGQGNKIVQILMTEIEAKETWSQIDLCWINGETFYQLQQI